jgi:hypothetical protein
MQNGAVHYSTGQRRNHLFLRGVEPRLTSAGQEHSVERSVPCLMMVWSLWTGQEGPGLKKFAGMGCEILEVFICGNVLSKYYEIVKHIL